MSDPGDAGLWAGIGAAIAGGIVGAKRLLSRKPEPEQLPEPSATSVRLGLLGQRVDKLEQEITMARHQTAQRLNDLSDSIEELKASSAVTQALIPRVESAIKELASELRDDRRRKE